jgi:hypothetical protein
MVVRQSLLAAVSLMVIDVGSLGSSYLLAHITLDTFNIILNNIMILFEM